MGVYICLLIFVIILANLMNKNKDKKINLLILSSIFILVLSFFAGIRTVELGYDASKYVVSVFYRISHTSGLHSFLQITTVEKGYSIFSYILYNIMADKHFLMFGYSFLTSLFIVLFAINEKDEIPITMTLIIYYLTIYIHSYNVIRQNIVITMFLFIFSLMRKKKSKILILLLLFVSFTFHDSVILGVPVFILYFIFSGEKELLTVNNKKIVPLLIFFIIICVVLFYSPLIELLNKIGVVSAKYLSYLSSASDSVDFNIADNTMRIICILIAIIFSIRDKEPAHRAMNNTIFFSSFIALMINVIALKIPVLYRGGLYYYYITLFYLMPRFHELFVKKYKVFINLFVYLIVFSLFIWKVYIGNTYNIYPYASDVFTIFNSKY